MDRCWFDYGGGRVSYWDTGGGGRTYLFVHGNGYFPGMFDSLIEELEGRSLVLELPGFGDSPDADLGMAGLGGLVFSFVSMLDLRGVVMCGYETGVLIGVSAAVKEPERYIGLVVVHCQSLPSAKLPMRLRLLRGSVDEETSRKVHQLYLRKGGKKGFPSPSTVAAARLLNEVTTSRTDHTFAFTLNALSKLESWDIPSLLIYGAKSFLFGDSVGLDLSRKMARARMEIVNSGKFFMYDSPEFVRIFTSWSKML